MAIESTSQQVSSEEPALRISVPEVEDGYSPGALVELVMQETAYQASLAVSARVMQPSLLEFLR